MDNSIPHSFVLVHGTNMGGWCWRRVADLLHKRGHIAFTPTLTGCGERSHLLNLDVDLDTHITDVVNMIKWERLTDVVLCGHSYGGWVISGVVERVPDLIRSIVYLDAFMPMDGQCGLDLQSASSKEAVIAARQAGELARLPGSVERYNINSQDREWVESLLTPQPIGVSLQPVRLTGARDRVARKSYIRATSWEFPHFESCYDNLKGDASWQVFELHCGHDVMIDMPNELTNILIDVA